jgi:hypothetical protein
MMRQSLVFRSLATLGLAAIAAFACSDSGGYGVSGLASQYTGLYNSSGTQLASNVNLQSVSFTLTYDTATGGSTVTYYPYQHSTTPNDPLRLDFQFSNSNWQTANANCVVGIQIANYVVSSDNMGNASVGSEECYWQLPNASPIFWWSTVFHTDNDYTDVNPRLIHYSDLTPNPLDPTRGSISWDSTSTSMFPWDLLPAISGVTTGSSTKYCGVIWVFVKPGHDGMSSADGASAIAAYPVAPGCLARP